MSAVPDFAELSEDWQQLWDNKTRFQRHDVSAEEFYPQRAGVLAEFGKVVCISCGYFVENEEGRQFRLRSFFGDDEQVLLSDFAQVLKNHFDKKAFVLCAHNGKEFDFPYVARRMVVHQIPLPSSLDIGGLKPWEVPHLDTLEMWKFGDRKNYTSIKLLTKLLDIPTPKDDIDGSQVGEVYWVEKNLERIVTYCEKDTVTVARLYLRLSGNGKLNDEEIHFPD